MKRCFAVLLLSLSVLIFSESFQGMCPYTISDELILRDSRVIASFTDDGVLENLAMLSNRFDSLMSLEILLNRKKFSVERYEVFNSSVTFQGKFGEIPGTIRYELENGILTSKVEYEKTGEIDELRLLVKTCDFEPLVFKGKDIHFIQGRHVAYAIDFPGSRSLYIGGMLVIVKRITNTESDSPGFTFSISTARDVESLKTKYGLSGKRVLLRKVVDKGGNPVVDINVALKIDGRYESVSSTDENGIVRFHVSGGKPSFEILGEDIRLEEREEKLVLSFPSKIEFRWNPYLTGLSTDSVYVGMRLTRPGTVVVLLGNEKITDDLVDTFHMVKLEKLIPQHTYRVNVMTMDDRATLNVIIPDFKKVSFAAYGDTRTNENWHEMVCNAMSKERISFVLHTGDLVESGDLIRDWDDFFKASKNLYSKVSIIPTLGNHERNSVYYYQAFMSPTKGGGDFFRRWYSVVYGDIRIIVLDSNVARGSSTDRKQLEWLENTLKKSKEKFKIVVFHHPFFTNAPNREPNHREDWQKLFEKYGVQLVLNGHIHHYERFLVNGVMYVTTGGGGAPLGFGLESPNRGHMKGTKAGVAGYLHYLVGTVEGDEIKFAVKSVARYDWGLLKRQEKILDEFVIHGR